MQWKRKTQDDYNGCSPTQRLVERNLTDEIVGGRFLVGMQSHQFLSRVTDGVCEVGARALVSAHRPTNSSHDSLCIAIGVTKGHSRHDCEGWVLLVLFFVEPRVRVPAAIWVVHGGTLLKAAPEHFKLACNEGRDRSDKYREKPESVTFHHGKNWTWTVC